MESIEEYERAEQDKLAKKLVKMEPKHYPDLSIVDEYIPLNSQKRSLTSSYQRIFVKPNIKKDNEYGLKPNQEFEVVTWNPFVVRSLNGQYFNNIDPSLFIP